MKQIAYQQKAVNELVDKTVDLLNLTGNRKKIVFKAPTGAGKTVMASEMLDRLVRELPTRTDSAIRDVAFIWIAPNKLHEQSYLKMKNFFSETRSLQPKMYDEIDRTVTGAIKFGEILFVNWESINKDKNVMVRDNENSASLYDIVRRTKEQGRNIIVVIDEEHMFAGKNAVKANNVLKRINPKVEIRISATPATTGADEMVNIPTEKVIDAGMIKQKIMLNPQIDVNAGDAGLNQMLLREALQKRQQLADAYKRLGVEINPLLLVQLPNDNSEALGLDEVAIADEVKQYLDAVHGINVDNNRLAIWLSGEKANLPGIEKPNSVVDVLLFKQAIALGWDCPRAAVLLIFRKVESFQFSVQTVGRIMRMPEQHFYTEGILNIGYVYTNLSKDMIQIVADDMNYISHAIVAKRREELDNVHLTSTYIQRPATDRNLIGPKFKGYIADAFKHLWEGDATLLVLNFTPFGDEDEDDVAEDVYVPEMGVLGGAIQHNREVAERIGIKLNVRNIVVDIPHDIEMAFPEAGTYNLPNGGKAKFARTVSELEMIFQDFCKKLLKGYEERYCTPMLSNYLKEYVCDNYGMLEHDAMKVILYFSNKEKFERVITYALQKYKEYLDKNKTLKVEENFVSYIWEVPEIREYDEESNKAMNGAPHHALQPFVREKRASNQEVIFETFLEKNGSHINWWYKNGDKGRQHFAVPYVNSQKEKSLFYVDYIIKMKNGDIYLFDTKSMNSDPEAPNKHNALIDYMNAPENSKINLKGGVIIENNGSWMYSQFKIEGTDSFAGWTVFNPIN